MFRTFLPKDSISIYCFTGVTEYRVVGILYSLCVRVSLFVLFPNYFYHQLYCIEVYKNLKIDTYIIIVN